MMDALSAFEATIGKPLPRQYRSFLAETWSSKSHLVHPDETGLLDFAIAELFGLADEPRLRDNFEPWTFYDLQQWKRELSAFISIGTTTTGELILLRLDSGSVHFLVTDFAEGEAPKILLIAQSFNAFVSALVTEDEVTTDADFEARLADMEAQRAADVRAYLEKNKDE